MRHDYPASVLQAVDDVSGEHLSGSTWSFSMLSPKAGFKTDETWLRCHDCPGDSPMLNGSNFLIKLLPSPGRSLGA